PSSRLESGEMRKKSCNVCTCEMPDDLIPSNMDNDKPLMLCVWTTSGCSSCRQSKSEASPSPPHKSTACHKSLSTIGCPLQFHKGYRFVSVSSRMCKLDWLSSEQVVGDPDADLRPVMTTVSVRFESSGRMHLRYVSVPPYSSG